MSDKYRDAVAKAGAKVARARLRLLIAEDELNAAMAEARGAPKAAYTDKYVVKLVNVGPNKIGVIKTVRQFTNLGLKEAKDLTDRASAFSHQLVHDDASYDMMEAMRREFSSVGATIDVVKSRKRL